MLKELRREKRVVIRYTPQAQIIINALKNYNLKKFEDEFVNEVIIGDAIVTRCILEKGIKQEKKNGT